MTLGERSVRQEGQYYFYELEEEKKITALCKLLNMNQLVDNVGRIPELRQMLPDRGDGYNEVQECVILYERDEHWSISIHKIIGVEYSSSAENKVSAKLQYDHHSIVSLSDSDEEFYGFWRVIPSRKKDVPYNGRKGISYWMNKAFLTNIRFRNFAVDFFNAEAEAEQKYILKDVARAISECGCFLPPVTYQETISFRTPEELLNSFKTEGSKLRVNFNKIDINVGYIMLMLEPEVNERDLKQRYKFEISKINGAITLPLLYNGFSAEEFLKGYYRNMGHVYDIRYENMSFAEDYIQLCREEEEKFRIVDSMYELAAEHDALAEKNRRRVNEAEFGVPLIAVPSKFDKLEEEIRKTGAAEFERIRTTEGLLKEGEYQHNCVFSRRGLVRSDRASIYHWEHKGKSYTIQFSRDRKGRYYVSEVRARFNDPISDVHLWDLGQLLRGFCDVEVRTLSRPAEDNDLPDHPDYPERLNLFGQIIPVDPDEVLPF